MNRRSRRRIAAGALGVVWSAAAFAVPGFAAGSFNSPQSAGPESFQTAAMSAAPVVTTATDNGCTAGTTNSFTLGWTDSQSSTLDASGQYLVSGYSIARATSAGGPYSALASQSGSPPAQKTTDSPAGASPSTAVAISQGTGTNKGVYPIAEGSSPSLGTKVTVGQMSTAPNAAQVTPDGLAIVLAESGGSQVQVLSGSGASWSVAATLTSPTLPQEIAIDPQPIAGHYMAYVVENFAGSTNDMVVPITVDGSSSSAGTAVSLGGRVTNPAAIVVTPDGSKVYVALSTSHEVVEFPTGVANPTVTMIALPGTKPAPAALAVTPDSSHVYVADQANSVVDDISVSSESVTKTVGLTSGSLSDPNTSVDSPNLIVLSPSGATLYVAEPGSDEIQVMNTALAASSPDTVEASPAGPSGDSPNGLAIDPDGCQVWASDGSNSDILVLNTSTDTLTRALTLTGTNDPQGFEVTPDNQYLIVADYSDSQVDVVNTTTHANVVLSHAGMTPRVVAITPAAYWYEVTASHGNFTSSASSAYLVSVGFDPGGWQ